MTKQPTLGKLITDSLDTEKFRKDLEWLNRQPKKGHRCYDCNHYYDEGDLFPDGNGNFLCPNCMEDREIIIEEERKLHHRG